MEAYIYEFLLGSCFAGRTIIGLAYILEFNLIRYHEIIVSLFIFCFSIDIIILTAWYQFVDRGYLKIQIILLGAAVLTFIYFAFLVPESPKWYYIKSAFAKSKEELVYVGRFNRLPKTKLDRIKTIKYDIEVLEERL